MHFSKKLICRVLILALLSAQVAPINASASNELPQISDLSNAIHSNDLNGVASFVENTKAAFAQITPNYKVNLDFIDAQGETPLTRAASLGHTDIVNYLVSKGANPNVKNSRGYTPAEMAVGNGFQQIADSLQMAPKPVLANTQVATAPPIAAVTPEPIVVPKIPIIQQPVAVTETVPVNMEVASVEPQIQPQIPQQVQPESKKVPANADRSNSGSGWSYAKYGVLGGAFVAGLAAAASGGGGGGSSGGGNSNNINGNSGAAGPGGVAIDCGAGAGDHPENCDPADFITGESAGNEGIANMKANYSLAHGYDGRIFNRDPNTGALLDDNPDGFIKVAVIDTGVDLNHVELNSNILEKSAVTCLVTGCVAGGMDEDGHGTAVASIIAGERNENGTGMHGVAPMAKILPVRVLETTDGSVAQGIDYAKVKSANVINMSLGYTRFGQIIPIVDTPDLTDGDAYSPLDLRSFMVRSDGGKTLLGTIQAAVANHSIFVIAAGNDSQTEVGVLAGLPYYFQGNPSSKPTGYDTVNPEKYNWINNFVAVVSLKDNNTVSSFSNTCGVSKEWCISAPGEINQMANLGGGYFSGQGTSFAAPNVSGAVAAMLGAFPHLSPEEVLQIIFDTATDLGTAGVDDIYGHGLVNLQKASDPSTGGWTLTSLGGMSYSAQSSHIVTSPVFGNSLNFSTTPLMFQDKYNKDYIIPLSALTGSSYVREDSSRKLERLGTGEFDTTLLLGENSIVQYSMQDKDHNNDQPNYYAENEQGYNADIRNLSFYSKIGSEKENMTFNFGYKTAPGEMRTASALSEVKQSNLSVTKAFNNPYLGFAKNAKSSVVGYNAKDFGLAFGVYDGDQKDDYSYKYSQGSGIRGMFAEYTVNADDTKVSFTAGTNIEENTFLGSEVSGAFDMDGSTTTNFAGVAAKYDVTDNFSLIGNYNIGVTNVNMSKNSLFTDMSGIVADSFALGAEYKNFANTGGKFGFNISQPLRVMSGKASAVLPLDIAQDGSVVFGRRSLSLSPTARQVDFETYYGLDVSETSKLALSGVISTNPGNMDTNEDEGLLLIKYSESF